MSDNLLWLAGNEAKNIPYKPAYATVTGSICSAILLQQIFYWWAASGKRGFYKFKSPCANPEYRKGDSWIEELQFGESAFNNARARIATEVANKNEVKPALSNKDVTHCVIYYRDGYNKTWYYFNPLAFEALIIEAKRLEQERDFKINKSLAYNVDDSMFNVYDEVVLPDTDTQSEIKLEIVTNEIKSGEIVEPKRNLVKTKKQKQPPLTIAQKNAENMPPLFTLEDNTLKVAIESGYESTDVFDEQFKFKSFYTKGKGHTSKQYDWDEHFLYSWLSNNYKWGRIKRNGRFYKLDANEERSDALRRQSTTDFFTDVTD